MATKKKRSSLSKKLFWLILLLLILNPIRTWYIQEQERKELNAQHALVQQQVETLEQEIEGLRHTLENITDDEHIEAMARKNLRMVHEDEWVLIDIQKQGN